MKEITENTVYNVTNRSASILTYRIPEKNIRREFGVGETKKITFGELQDLTFQPGGKELIANYLQLTRDEPLDELNIHREPEYVMSAEDVKNLLLTGSVDALLDALDFAPEGVIELIKTIAVQLPLVDLNKINAIKDKTGFDVNAAVAHNEEDKEAAAEAGAVTEATTPTRRVQPQATSGRRTTPQYKVVSKTEEE